MAAVAPPADQAADLLKNMSLDSQSKTLETSEAAKKPSVESGNNGNILNQPFERSLTPLIPDLMDPTVAYFPNGYPSPAYYYGYDGTTNDWDDYSRYINPDGVDMSHGAYGENGSIMYPGYGYTPYGPYSPAGSPVPTASHDGQLYGAQHYQYPTPYFQPMTNTATAPPKVEVSRSTPVDTGNPNSITNGNMNSAPVRPPVYQSSSVFNRDPRYGFDGTHSSIPWIDSPLRNNNITPPLFNSNGFSSKNQNVHPQSHILCPSPMSGINAANSYMNRMYPNKLYNQYNNNYTSYGNNWMTVDNKYKPRGKANGFFNYPNENIDGLNELNRGPRAKITRPRITISVKGQNGNLTSLDGVEKIFTTPDKDQYNKTEFPETYEDAKFFVIKSYSEDDVHKSIKYDVWSSTQNGNKKLESAYQESLQKSGQYCPVFLFFSVNTSGQFVGVAEMVGPVDFNKSLEYWQQDKWIGCFPVKWHIVKDVPNTLLKHIILENNENKPVTNSRDTQEVKLEQGLQMIKIFKEHSSKQCILDDFEFYEDRQKRIQEKKAKQLQYQKQTWEEKLTVGEKKDDVENHEAKTTVNGVVANGC